MPLTVADPVTARILAAQLGAEGVVWEIRGNVGSPYPVGPVELLVDRDSLDLARELLAGAELPPDTELPPDADPLAHAQLAADADPLADPEAPHAEPWAEVEPTDPALSADRGPASDEPTPGIDAQPLADTGQRRPAPPRKLGPLYDGPRTKQPARGRSWLAAAVVLALLVIAVARIMTAAL